MRSNLLLLTSTLLPTVFSTRLSKQSNAANTFDYLIIGSGPGGGPLAANLALAGYSVGLIEAGSDQSQNLAQVGAGFFMGAEPSMTWDFFAHNTDDEDEEKKDWKMTYRTVEGGYYTGRNPPVGAVPLGTYYPRGATLGGSSSVNAMCAFMPSRSDWDVIARITGDRSWRHENIAKYYNRTRQWLDLNTADHYYYYNGANTNYDTVIKAIIASTGQDPALYPELIKRDINDLSDPLRDFKPAFYPLYQHKDDRGRRSNSMTRLMEVYKQEDEDGRKKYPLTFILKTLATKVLFEKGTKRAIGVEVLEGDNIYQADPQYNSTFRGVKKTYYARREVIISAGVINTPQLLLLSGIGPRKHLKEHGIPVLVNNPAVGSNLQDNPESAITHIAQEAFVNHRTAHCTRRLDDSNPCFTEWLVNGTGPLTGSGAGGFALLYSSPNSALGENDFYMFGGNPGLRGFWPATTRLDPDSPMITNNRTWAFSMAKMHPKDATLKSEGTIRLRSNDPTEVPDIRLRFFDDKRNKKGAKKDLDAFHAAFNFGRKILSKIGGPLGPFVELEPCNNSTPETAANCKPAQADRELVKREVFSHHATSSCSIGSCVDSEFRVYGTKGLRVVDASVFPRIPGPFPVLPTFVISEKASEVILRDARGKSRN